MLYLLGMFSIAVFAITSLIATQNKNLDIFSAVFLGCVTALGGGTVRDMILGNYPVYWVDDLWFLWVATITSVIGFFLIRFLTNRQQVFLYLDALGISLFAITAAEKTLLLGLSPSIAIVMGVITAILGGILRDIFTNSPSLLLQKELYATPVLIGTCFYVLTTEQWQHPEISIPVCVALTFIFRVVAIRYHLQYPSWLCSR